MLKLKDNVKLKELESFGFKKYITSNREVYGIKTQCKARWKTADKLFITVDKYSKIIRFTNPTKSCNVLFDLIQAGLVEKIVEEIEEE